MDYCILSILFSRFLIFTIIILNSFKGNFPISSSYIWTSVFLVYSFICAVFRCLLIVFKVIMFEVSFTQASRKVEFFPWRRLNSFFLLVSALLRLVQWFVWALYRVRFVLSFCLFDWFSSDGQGWVRWYSCLLMTGFVFLFCLLFRWGVLHRVLLVVGWCRTLYSSVLFCVSSHYLILPRVSSLVV